MSEISHPITTPAIAALPRRLELGIVRVWVADPAMERLFELLARMSASKLPILLNGETGAGKEIAAHAVHRFSPRRERPMVSINCAAIPDGLAESELFGHEKGAFSGATSKKLGLFEMATGGTVFLDEVGELPLPTQARLLRALDSHRITRVGAVVERPIDVRIVAATNRDLTADIKTGRFRADLYFRLNGASVVVPPLRDRPRDLPLLARDFLSAARARLGLRDARLTDAAMHRMAAYSWPGNIRELKHAMEYAATVAQGAEVDVLHLPPALSGVEPCGESVTSPETVPPRLGPLVDELLAESLLDENGQPSVLTSDYGLEEHFDYDARQRATRVTSLNVNAGAYPLVGLWGRNPRSSRGPVAVLKRRYRGTRSRSARTTGSHNNDHLL